MKDWELNFPRQPSALCVCVLIQAYSKTLVWYHMTVYVHVCVSAYVCVDVSEYAMHVWQCVCVCVCVSTLIYYKK